uniref:Uncharacterized protein n=1 Tax=Parascaris univalens TaxID=6257 RepID=A0A914ZI94_PARUN
MAHRLQSCAAKMTPNTTIALLSRRHRIPKRFRRQINRSLSDQDESIKQIQKPAKELLQLAFSTIRNPNKASAPLLTYTSSTVGDGTYGAGHCSQHSASTCYSIASRKPTSTKCSVQHFKEYEVAGCTQQFYQSYRILPMLRGILNA